MGIERFFVEDLTIRRWPTKTTAHNDTVRDLDATPADTPVVGWVGPAVTVERLTGGRTEERILRPCRLPIGTDLKANDQILRALDGLTYEVDGTPDAAPTPAGPHHVHARLLAVIG